MREIVKNLEAKDFRMQNKLNELEFKDYQSARRNAVR